MRAWLSLLAAAALSFPAIAQEHPIRIYRPSKVGQQFRLTADAQASQRGIMILAGKTLQELKQEVEVHLVAAVTVLEVSDKGEITKASYQISDSSRKVGTTKKEMFPRGTVVTGWFVENGEDRFTVGDKPVEKEFQEALTLVAALGKEQLVSDEILGSSKPRRVGESWDIKTDAAAEMLGKMRLQVRSQDLTGRATLDRLTEIDGIECLDITAKIYLKKFGAPLPPGLEMKNSFGSIRVAGKFPKEASMGAVEETIDVTAEFNAQGKGPPNAPAPTFKGSSTARRTARMVYSAKE